MAIKRWTDDELDDLHDDVEKLNAIVIGDGKDPGLAPQMLWSNQNVTSLMKVVFGDHGRRGGMVFRLDVITILLVVAALGNWFGPVLKAMFEKLF